MSRFLILLALLLVALPPLARAQSAPDLDKAEAALLEAWTKAPLSVRRAVFVSEPPAGYGVYKERSSAFKSGEKLITYAEPVAFGYRELGNDAYEFGFTVDFVVKTADGRILAGQESFAKLGMQSHRRNREFMLTLTLDVTGLTPGAYKLEYRLHDNTGNNKSISFEQPFSIVE